MMTRSISICWVLVVLLIFALSLQGGVIWGVRQGGTGTATPFTAGSVVFAGSGGIFSQANTYLFWDNTNKRLGIGTTAPSTTIGFGGEAARTIGMERRTGSAGTGYGLTISGGGAKLASTDKAAGDVTIAAGTSTGSGSGSIILQTPTPGSTGTTDNAAATVATIDYTGATFGGDLARAIALARRTEVAGTGLGLSLGAGGAKLTSTDKAGGDVTIAAGTSTGSGSGSIILQTPTPGSTGTSDNAAATVATISYAGATFGGELARAVAMARRTDSAGTGLALTVGAGGAKSASTDKAGGNLALQSGISTGSGTSSILLQTPAAGSTGTTDHAAATRLTIGSSGIVAVPAISSTQVAVTSAGNASTFDATAGNSFKITLTENSTLTVTGAVAGQMITALVCQDGNGNHTWTWPGTIKGGFTVTATASKCDAQSFVCDATNCWATSAGKQNM